MSDNDSEFRSTDEDKPLDDLLYDYIDRLNAGEILDKERIREEQPDYAEALIEKLQVFEGIGVVFEPKDPLGTLGDYTLRRQIGRGGMGVTCAALRYVKSFPCASLNLFPSIRLRPCGPSDCCT